jgi:hypothetical protein
MLEERQKNLETDLKAILISAYQEIFQKWERCWQWCTASHGHYFKGDNTTSEQFSINKDIGCQSRNYLIKPHTRRSISSGTVSVLSATVNN